MSDGLFPLDPAQVRMDTVAEQMSAGRRLTVRQSEAIKAGSHPMSIPLMRHLAIHPAAPAERTCGNCRFRELLAYHNATYPKCTRDGMPRTHGTATDVRRWWPGCVHHEYESEAADG